MTALAQRGPEGEAAAPVHALAVRRLELQDFRNYATLALEPAHAAIVLHGDNGAGKTNLLEAVSLLAPDRKSVV